MKRMVRLTRFRSAVTALLLVTLLLGACGETPTPLPTATPVPPTATLSANEHPGAADRHPGAADRYAVPPTATPTNTPVPPTATPIPPTATPVPPPTRPSPRHADKHARADPGSHQHPKPTAVPKVGKILFTSNRMSWDDIFVMDENGANVKRLTKMGKCYNAHFSPDAKRIVFDSGADIWVMNADGSGQANVTNTGGELKCSPSFVRRQEHRLSVCFGGRL